MNKFKIIFSIFIVINLTIFLFQVVFAQEPSQPPPSPLNALEKIQEIVTPQLMPSYPDPILTIVRILNYLINLVGVAFLILIFYGGIRWMVAGSNEEEVKKAKAILKAALVGLIIIILARVLYIFVLERIKGGGGPVGSVEG